MCDHGGTEVLNLSQNNLSLVPEFPFSLVISKMREVYKSNHITSKAKSITVWVITAFHCNQSPPPNPGEPHQCPPKPWSSSFTNDTSGRCVKPIHPQNQWKRPFFSARYSFLKQFCHPVLITSSLKSSANVLAKAVNSMVEVDISKCSLTIYQVLSFMTF